MRSTFRVLFYTKNQSIKNGKVPVMGRITINKTTACFSCKKEVSISLWDAKANRAKGKSEEARMLNQELIMPKPKLPSITNTYAIMTVLSQPRKSIAAMSVLKKIPTPLWSFSGNSLSHTRRK